MSKKKNSFLNFLLLSLNNHRGEIGEDSESQPVDLVDKYDNFLSDQESESADDATDSDIENVEAKESNEEEGEDKDKTLEEQLDSLKLEDEEGKEKSLSDLVNSLGITRKGTPVEFKDDDEIKEMLSKESDYTVKTQEHAEAVKNWEAESTKKDEAFNSEIEEFNTYKDSVQNEILSNQVMQNLMADLKESDPEYFEELEGRYNNAMETHFASQDNPMINGLKETIAAQDEKINQIIKKDEEKEFQFEQKKYDDGISNIQKQWGAKLKTLGVSVNYDKVLESYKAAGGKLDVKQAFQAVNGESITKAMESHKKLIETKAKSNLRTNGQNAVQDEVDDGQPKKHESMFDAIKRIAAGRDNAA